MSEYDLAKKRFLDKCAELHIAVPADVDVSIASERLNGYSRLDRELLNYFAYQGRQYCQQLLDDTFQPKWHCIKFETLGERLFNPSYDVFNVAQSQAAALSFVLRLLSKGGLSAQAVFGCEDLLIRSDDGDIARIFPVAYQPYDQAGAKRVTDALKHLHEYTADAKVAARLKRIPGLEQCQHRDQEYPHVPETLCIHNTANNFAHNMKMMVQRLCNGRAPTLNISQELLAAYAGSESWQHFKAAEKQRKRIAPPYLLLAKPHGQDYRQMHFYNDKSEAIWAFAVALKHNSNRDYWHNDRLSYFTNDFPNKKFPEPAVELTLWQLEDEGEDGRFLLMAQRLIESKNTSGKPELPISPLELVDVMNAGTNHVTKCPLCDFSYALDLTEDCAEHQAFHNQCKEAEEEFGLRLMVYEKQEDEKKLAHRELESDELKTQTQGALRLIKAHFHRSLFAAVSRGDWREHPRFDDYIAMVDDYESVIPNAAMVSLRQQYGRREGFIEEGSSYWSPQSKPSKRSHI
mgnify:CR=1 FL=1